MLSPTEPMLDALAFVLDYLWMKKSATTGNDPLRIGALVNDLGFFEGFSFRDQEAIERECGR